MSSAHILLLVNYRPEYRHDWGRLPCYLQLQLAPLGPAEAEGLLSALLGDDASLVPLKQLILSKTEGNPFFMEEVVQTLADEHALLGQPGSYRIDKPPLALHMPTTVQGVLAARIDRLPIPQKELLQTLAVIGTDFPVSLVRHVTEQSDDMLHPLLADLQAGDFIYERPAFPEVEYAFKHALTQEVAGNSLLSTQRGRLHERTAQAIEALFPDRLNEYCSELAHHYSQSGNVPKAVEYLQLAGKQAMQRSAQMEAIGHLRAALELLTTLPETPERHREELALLLTLGPAWMAARGYGAPEVEATYTRALALSEQGGDTPQFFSAQLGLWSFYLLRAQLHTAQALGERLLGLAQDAQDPEQLAEAHRVLGATVFRLGQIEQARAQMEQALALHHPDRPSYGHFLRYARNPAVHVRSTLSWILWYLGWPDQARVRCEEALALARQASDPFALALSLIFAAELYQRLGEREATLEYANAALALSREQGFPHYLAWATILRGWVLARQGSFEAGIALIHQGLRDHQATGPRWGGHPCWDCSPMPMALPGSRNPGCACWTTRWRWCTAPASALMPRRCIVCRASCGWRGPTSRPVRPPRTPSLKRVSRKPSASPVSKRPHRLPCKAPYASPGCGIAKARTVRPGTCWSKSRARLRKGRIPRTCARPERSWTTCRKGWGDGKSPLRLCATVTLQGVSQRRALTVRAQRATCASEGGALRGHCLH